MEYFLCIVEEWNNDRLVSRTHISPVLADLVTKRHVDEHTLFNEKGVKYITSDYSDINDMAISVEISQEYNGQPEFEKEFEGMLENIVIMSTNRGNCFLMRKHLDDDEELSVDFINRHFEYLVIDSYEITTDFKRTVQLPFAYDIDKRFDNMDSL